MYSSLWKDFLVNFLANGLSDLLVGAALGTALAWWVNRKISTLERSEQRMDEKRAGLEKTIHYLRALRDEVQSLLDQLPDLLDESDPHQWMQRAAISIPLWDLLEPSGELPRLLDPRLLSPIARFYEHFRRAQYVLDVRDSGQAVEPQHKGYIGDTATIKARSELELALAGKDLPSKIDSEVLLLEAQLLKTI